MTDTEGTIQFAYALEHPAGPVAEPDVVRSLAGWRAVFRRLDLLGQHRDRYQGFGYGNLSSRDGSRPDEFVITASQTAGAPDFDDSSLVRITHSNVARFWVDAVGQQPPSSETLTHAIVYQADRSIGWVFHVHCPEIWQRHADLGLPATPEHAPCGSAAMADAVEVLLARHHVRPVVFVTLGHEDGVFACGTDAAATGNALVALLARALS